MRPNRNKHLRPIVKVFNNIVGFINYCKNFKIN